MVPNRATHDMLRRGLSKSIETTANHLLFAHIKILKKKHKKKAGTSLPVSFSA